MDEFEELHPMMYVDKDLKPLKLEEWAELFENFSYRLIARTPIGTMTINTVWMGINLPFGTPFETGIFQDGELIEEQSHTTKEQAIDYHLMMVMAYVNKGFLEFLQKEDLCHQSPAPTVEQTS